MISLKKSKIGRTTTNITLSHTNTEFDRYSKDEITALMILLGGYNEFGRKINLQTYKVTKELFDKAIADMTFYLQEANSKSEVK